MRNTLGALDRDLWLAGTVRGPERQLAPNITPDRATGIGGWRADEIAELPRSGLKPDFDDLPGAMEEATEHGFKHLREGDLAAIAEHLRARSDRQPGRAQAPLSGAKPAPRRRRAPERGRALSAPGPGITVRARSQA